LVAVAWPYANAEIHVGNLTGSYLPADIFARYNRLRGRQVLMVSGSDSHGTPITVRADAEKKTSLEVYQEYHASFLELFQKLGLTYDIFTSTHTSNHTRVAQAMFKALLRNGFLYKDKQLQWYSPSSPENSSPTAMWKAPVISAATLMPAATSVTSVAICSIRPV